MIFKPRLLILQRALSAFVVNCLFLPALRASSSGSPVKSTGLSDSTLMSLSATTIVAISPLSYREVRATLSFNSRPQSGFTKNQHREIRPLCDYGSPLRFRERGRGEGSPRPEFAEGSSRDPASYICKPLYKPLTS
jgi:hypothetical protein